MVIYVYIKNVEFFLTDLYIKNAFERSLQTYKNGKIQLY